MRSIKELLEVMLENQHLFGLGLCTWNIEMKHSCLINYDEYMLLKMYIINNRPFNLYTLTIGGFYWKPKDIKPRLKWILKHIKKNS